ncbi:MAG: DUF3500 domain-containing protein [Bacteroidota bacterium]
MKHFVFLVACFMLFSKNMDAQKSVVAANHFITLLSTQQKMETVFPFDSDERYNYHFVPIERKGITFNELNELQRIAAFDLLKTCLGDEAFIKTKEIMQLDQVLKELENRKDEDHYRDPANYHITIFGIPSAKTIWGWRFEGHHISFNFSFSKQTLISGTPGFMGSNPGIVLNGSHKGKQVLKDETESGFKLLRSLNESQFTKTIIDSIAYKDILSFDKRVLMLKSPEGIRYSELTKEQQQLMLQLISVYVHRYTQLFAEDMLKEIQASGLENLWFAWAGDRNSMMGKGTYYRVQGPTILIEYDNTQNNANHVHSVIRDLKHDFGGDELLQHYKTEHAQ